jgi:hypothetical protein
MGSEMQFSELDEYDQNKLMAWDGFFGSREKSVDFIIDNTWLFNSKNLREFAFDYCEYYCKSNDVDFDFLDGFFDHLAWFEKNKPKFVKCTDGFFVFNV